MNSSHAHVAIDLRRYLTAFVAQLVLTGIAVLVSRWRPDAGVGAVAVMIVAAVNALVVAIVLMGVRRDGRFISVLALITIVFLTGLLIWPAWDVYDRVRVF